MPLEPDTPPSARLLLAGDVMLDRDIYATAKKSGNYAYPFELIDPLLDEFDAVIANLEGPITEFAPVATPGGVLQFTFSRNFVPEIAKRFSAMSLANNHMLDFGQAGLAQTRETLNEAGVLAFGGPQGTSAEHTATVVRNDITIGLVGYHAVRELDTESAVAAIQTIRPHVDFVIVYPHWGIEYERSASAAQKKEAHAFVDAGADLIIGSHPHVVQPVEIYNNKVIFYSLGNFVFDQYWSEETMRSLAVGLEIEKTKTGFTQTFTLYPLRLNGSGQPERALDDIAADMLARLAEKSTVADMVREQIKNRVFTVAELP